MPVIIRELRSIAGSPPALIKVYKPGDVPVTKSDKEKADRLDEELDLEMKKIENEMKKSGFIKLKGKKGAIKLWYEVGRRLAPVVNSLDLQSGEKKYVWRAIYDHVEELKPGEPKIRANERPEDSHFSYCYQLAAFKWDFVQKVGDWTTWYELLDSTLFRKDRRLMQWLASKQKDITSSQQNWLRPLTKAIRNELKKYDTTGFNNEELYEKLYTIFKRIHPDELRK